MEGGKGWGGCLAEEGLLIKAHQDRSVSTGGRVVQEHRDTPGAVRRSRQSEGDRIELRQLDEADRQRHREKTLTRTLQSVISFRRWIKPSVPPTAATKIT